MKTHIEHSGEDTGTILVLESRISVLERVITQYAKENMDLRLDVARTNQENS